MTTRTRSTNCVQRSLGRYAWFFVSLVLACFGLLPGTQAVIPAPDGGYPGGNTVERLNSLFSLATGRYHTAVGFFSLRSNTWHQVPNNPGDYIANNADGVLSNPNVDGVSIRLHWNDL